MNRFLHAALLASAISAGLAFAACGGDDKDDNSDGKPDAGIVVSDAGHSAADASSDDDASIGDAGSGCSSDTDCTNASCRTSTGECIAENSQCVGHTNCGDTQYCDLSELTEESIFGACKKGERPADGLACGAESLKEGEDCESGVAIDGADEKAYCTCDCDTSDTCPSVLPKCNDYLGMCIYPQNQ